MENSILATLTEEMAGQTRGSSVVAVTGLAPMSFAIELRKGVQETSSFLVVCLDPHFPAMFTLDVPVSSILPRTPAETLPQGFTESMSDSLRQTSLDAIEQYNSDRVVKMRFSAKGRHSPFVVWLELFGRKPNAVLVDENTNLIDACSREGATSSAGVILRPGERYVSPSQGNKIDIESLSLRVLECLMEKSGNTERREELPITLSRLLKGMSPRAAEQILEDLSSVGRLTPEGLLEKLKEALTHPERHFCPAVLPASPDLSRPPALIPVYRGGEVKLADAGVKDTIDEDAFSPEIRCVPKCFPTASEATRFSFLELCRWYRRVAAARLRRHAIALSERLTRLRALLSQDFSASTRADEFRAAGELILANLKSIKRGSEFAELRDIHVDGQFLVRIELDPSLSPSDNAERYFKKARKAQRASALLKRRIASVEGSLQMVGEFRENIPEEVNAEELVAFSRARKELEIRLHVPAATDSRVETAAMLLMSEAGAAGRADKRERERKTIRGRVAPASGAETKGGVRAATGAGTGGGAETRGGAGAGGRAETRGGAVFNPRLFDTSDGFDVFVGRNNKENDYVTHRLARPEDLWFHASGIPGSHVILRKKGKSAPTRRAIEEAAAIAAYFSKGRTSSAVPVIYTEKKYVHRPRGSRPGTATCAREKFLMVTPRKPKPALPR